MSKIFSALFLVVVIVALVALTSNANAERLQQLRGKHLHSTADGTNCGIVAAPCDNTWQSRFNQTFAFEAAGPFVQLKSYWQNYDACLSGTNSTPLSFYYTTCQQNSSLWSYGPSALTTYVYYNNTQNLCLTRDEFPLDNSTSAFVYGLSMQDCCLNEKSESRITPPCSRDKVMRQMWLEKPVVTDPYNRINNLKMEHGASKDGRICLTRVSDSC